jgi:hypothetical protein
LPCAAVIGQPLDVAVVQLAQDVKRLAHAPSPFR